MDTVPTNSTYDATDMLKRVHYLVEAIHYKVQEIDDRNLVEEKIMQYHFLIGIFTDLRFLEGQLKCYVKEMEK